MLSLDAFRTVFSQPNLMRAIVNSIAIGVFGGALAVFCYTFVGLAMHRKPDNVTRFMDYSVLVPRAVPGLLAGLAFLWVFLFVPMWLDNALDADLGGWLSGLPFAEWLRENFIEWLRSMRSTIFSVWLAYTVVWMAYGLRLISSTLLQVGPELEEAARSAGARRGQVTRHVTVPLAKYGLIGSWLLMFLIFEREYSTGVYLLSPGTETIGSMLVSLWASGAIDIVAALSFINIVLVVIGLGIALRFESNFMIELSVEDLHLDYGDNPVLKGVSMQLRQGEVVSLLGPSGSGKTTLLRAVAGLEGPKRGRITIGDRVVYDGAARREIPAEERNLGLVFQSYALWPHKTVFDNVAYPLKLRKTPQAEVRERVQAVLDQLGLGKLGQRHPHQLSGGQQQRVAIGRALVYSPPVILLDEPLSNLDAKLREEARAFLRELIVRLACRR